MNYSIAEQSIVTRLAPLVDAGVPVSLMPNTQNEYKTPTGPQVWVTFDRATYDQTSLDPRIRNTGPIEQKEVIQFSIIVNSRQLRNAENETGVLEIMKAIRLLLVGFKPANCNKMYMIEVVPEKFDENLWTFKMVFGCSSLLIEDTAEEIGPKITKILLDNTTLNEQVVIQ